MKWWLPILAVLLVRAAHAEPTMVLAEEQRIKSPGTATLTFDLPEVSAGQQVRLSLQARVDWPNLAGSNPWVSVNVNGKDLFGPDLLNKPLEFTMCCGMDTTWAHGNSWRICYSPDFSDVLRTVPMPLGIPDCDPYRFVWDITRCVRPGKNTLVCTHPHLLAGGTTLVLHDIRVETGAPVKPAAEAAVQPVPTGPLPTYVPRGRQPVKLAAELSAGGAVRLRVAGRTLDFSSRDSLPDGKWVSTTAEGWRPVTRDRPAEAHWTGAGYEVRRQVSLRDDHVHVADTITNTSGSLVGVIHENRLAWTAKPDEILLGGRPVFSDTQESWEPCHPTALARWGRFTVGLVTEDDIFRVHSRAFREPQALGLADPQLGLAPGQSHTLEWSIYPVPEGDYWDFINAVRRNWGSNITIPAIVFDPGADGSQSVEALGQWAKRRSARVIVSGQTVFQGDEVAEGTAIPLAKHWCESAAEWSRKLHAADPSLKVLIYLHAQICTEPTAEKLYADSRLLDQNGQQVTTPYRYPIYVYLSTLQNSYRPALLKTLKQVMIDLHADGIYHDEMEWASTPWAYDAPWDGCSAIINPETHAVTGKRSSVALLQQRWKVAVVGWLRDTGRTIIGNSQPSTRTMLNLKVPRFVETASYSFLIETHLGCPWGLGNHDAEANDASRARQTRRMLDYGGVLAPYTWGDEPTDPPFTRVMYPVTPLELHPGMVLGEERILTNRSGLYGWPDGSAAQVHVFDAEGREVARPLVKEVRQGGRLLTEVRMPGDHFAVLVRQRR